MKRRKHCGKRKKCWLPAFCPFPRCFEKASVPGSFKLGLFGKELTFSQTQVIRLQGSQKTVTDWLISFPMFFLTRGVIQITLDPSIQRFHAYENVIPKVSSGV